MNNNKKLLIINISYLIKLIGHIYDYNRKYTRLSYSGFYGISCNIQNNRMHKLISVIMPSKLIFPINFLGHI